MRLGTEGPRVSTRAELGVLGRNGHVVGGDVQCSGNAGTWLDFGASVLMECNHCGDLMGLRVC